MDYTVYGILQARTLEWIAFPFFRGLPKPGIEPRSPTLQADSLPAEPQGKPKNTGVGSLSLLQQIFPIQELNQGLLHCRQILYQLSYQGSPVTDGYTLIQYYAKNEPQQSVLVSILWLAVCMGLMGMGEVKWL